MIKNFRAYNLAVDFNRLANAIKLPCHLKDQLSRAASSICLNLAEGSARRTSVDQRRFFYIAFGSLRECEAILDLSSEENVEAKALADKLAAHIYCLIKRVRGR